MNSAIIGLPVYLCIGFMGGFLGNKFKIPAGTLIGTMLAIIVFRLIINKGWTLPRGYGFILQVLLGIMIGASFQKQMLRLSFHVAIPVVISTIVLVSTGLILSAIFSRIGLLDISTAYLSTSPGAMSVLVLLAFESQANPTLVLTFHFFRIVFVVLTIPWILKIFVKC